MAKIVSISSARPQYFSLPPVIIHNILKHPSSGLGLMKLYKTCKYFFLKKKLFFFSRYYHENDDYGSFHLGWKYQTQKEKFLFWLLSELEIFGSECFPSQQIYRCTIGKLDLSFSTISFENFNIIVKENTIKVFWILNSQILKSDGSDTTIDEILQKLPNVVEIFYRIDETIITSTTLKNLKSINFWNKLKHFSIKINYSSDIFDSLLLCDFFKLNAAPASNFKIIIKGLNSENHYESLKNAAEKMLEKWDKEKPKIEILHGNI